jgi:hypothetical protein
MEDSMLLYSGDSGNLEEQEQEQKQDIVRHHHFIACKNHDRTIMKKLNSFRMTQQNQLEEQIDNISVTNKRIMLVEDEANIAMAFKIVLESDARSKVDSFTGPFTPLNKELIRRVKNMLGI